MLQEAIAKAEGDDGKAEERELEELKQLLPEIREKVEDAAESQRTASAATQAIHQALVSTGFRGDACTFRQGCDFWTRPCRVEPQPHRRSGVKMAALRHHLWSPPAR